MPFPPSSPSSLFLSPTSTSSLSYPFSFSSTLSNSIAYGVIAGVISYMMLNGIPFFLRKISRGRIVPHDYENSERWVIPPGSILPFWVRKLLGRTEAGDNRPDFEARQTSRTGTEPDSMLEKTAPQNTV